MAVVITGTPGTGKHSAARELAARGGRRIVDINEVAAEAGLLEGGAGSSDVDVSRLEGALGGRILPDSLVVGHLAPHAVSAGLVDAAIVLRRSPYELMSVYAERGYPEHKARENAGAEILGVVLAEAAGAFGRERTFQVVSDGRGTAGIADAIAGIVSGEGGGEHADWLGEVAQRGDLKRFFVD